MSKIVPVSPKIHAQKKLNPLTSFAFAAKNTTVPIIASEITVAARSLPLLFLKQEGELGLFALLGLPNDKNVFINRNGKWTGDYVPATLRRYPFIFATSDDKEGYVLCIDEESGLLSDDEGTPLFDEDNKKSDFLEKIFNFLTDYQRGALATQEFCREMDRLELLTPFNVELKSGEEKNIKIGGMLSINEKKLNDLSDEDFIMLRKKGFMALIYAHLLSLGNLSALLPKPVPFKSKPAQEAVIPESFKF